MAFITNDPPRPLWQRILYRTIQWITLIGLKILYRYQYRHIERIPMTSGALICPNHLSHLDPMALGCVVRRRASFLTKKTLFNNKLLGGLLHGLHCIPIDREATGIGGMKETLKRLKKGEHVILFPEGERSWEGTLLPLMTGFTALVKRVKVPIVPIGIHGTYEAFPRGASRPKLGRIKLVVGHPIPFDAIADMEENEMATYVGDRIAECYHEAREWNSK